VLFEGKIETSVELWIEQLDLAWCS